VKAAIRLACVGPACSNGVPATGFELLAVAVIVAALVAVVGVAFGVLARYAG
jgi:hypothetical protein